MMMMMMMMMKVDESRWKAYRSICHIWPYNYVPMLRRFQDSEMVENRLFNQPYDVFGVP